jgi:DNA/RNA-binding protein KIN17
VDRVRDKYVGELVMADSGDVIRIDQAELETVLPAPGGAVLVVNGHHRGLAGRLLAIDVSKYQAQVGAVGVVVRRCRGCCRPGCGR